jgi:hypothetical protein
MKAGFNSLHEKLSTPTAPASRHGDAEWGPLASRSSIVREASKTNLELSVKKFLASGSAVAAVALTLTACAAAPTTAPAKPTSTDLINVTDEERQTARAASSGYITLEAFTDHSPAMSVVHGSVSPYCLAAVTEYNDAAKKFFIEKSNVNLQTAKLATWHQSTSCRSQ